MKTVAHRFTLFRSKAYIQQLNPWHSLLSRLPILPAPTQQNSRPNLRKATSQQSINIRKPPCEKRLLKQ